MAVGINLFRPEDESGVPRRFRGHGEAFAWVASSLARICVPRFLWGSFYAIAAWLAWLAVRSVFPSFMPDAFPGGWSWVFYVAAILGALITLFVLGSAVIYAYIVLAGGVMRRDERKRPFS